LFLLKKILKIISNILKIEIHFSLLLIILFISCTTENKKCTHNQHPQLRSLFDIFFPIGQGIHLTDLESDSSYLISKHFNSISTANAFKFETIHPHLDEYDFNESDSIVAFAQKNNMKVRGHTLVWGARNPYWLIWDAKGNMVNRKILEDRLKDHIISVVGRYKTKVYAWDVVNEAVFDNKKEFLKPTVWYKILGEEFIYKAFQYTHEADSNALLFYNDYDAEQPSKRDRIVKLINNVKNRNIPIHGIGIQGHWTPQNLNLSDLEDAIDIYSAMGLQVQITELHITKPDDPNATDADTMEELATIYHDLFKVLLKHKHQITGVTFWGSENPKNRHYPLFDSSFKPTIVYQSIANAN
jgi:endo-1,4-beta-xylanase